MTSNHFISIVFVSALSLLTSGHLVAQDVIVIEREDGKQTKRTGVIVDWQGAKISLASGERTRTIDVADVKQINTQWPDQLAVARKQINENDLTSAIASLNDAKTNEERGWVKAIIGSELLQTHNGIENHKASIREFVQLYAADKSTRFFHLIPLAWSIGEQNIPPQTELSRWLTNDNDVLRLIGASWLLSRGSNSDAISELEKLTNSHDPRIAQLALAQLWRTRLLSANQTDIDRWKRQLEKIQPELRAGPLAVLAQAQNRSGNKQQAQINLMKIRILHKENKLLSAYSLYLCGNIMADLNQTDRAKAIWNELVSEFPSSQYAKLAGNKM